MTKNATPIAPVVSLIEAPRDTPLVAPEEAKAGEKTTNADRALSALAVSQGLTETLHKRAEEAKARQEALIAINEATAHYFTVKADNEGNEFAGQVATTAVEEAAGTVARAYADAVMSDLLTRKEARQRLGQSFGFKVSDKTGKPTSQPLEPGNTIAKRVSSVTIAIDYMLTGELPDKGGDNLPLVGQTALEEILSDYLTGDITVRAASERIESAIREARVNIPLELNVDKLLTLAGKIQTTSDAIASDETLQEAYAILLETIASIPFPAKAG